MSEWNVEQVVSRFPSAGGKYTVNAFVGDCMETVRGLEPDELNWVFLATSGVHGTYSSLDDATADLSMFETDKPAWREQWAMDEHEPLPEAWSFGITVLVVMPRCVTTYYGEAELRNREDIALLRLRVAQTFAGITESQKGCRMTATPESCEGMP